MSATLIACGGGGGSSSPTPAPTPLPTPTPTYTIGGTVSGLAGSLVLQNNSAGNLTIAANGTFTFATAVSSGGAYAVSVFTQPSGQSCAVSSGSGNATANVTNIVVTCVNVAPTTYTIGGMVSGLNGSVVLQNNAADNLTITASGAFTFATAVNSGGSYAVSVLTQPSGQSCTASNDSGTATANVSNVMITCVDVVPPATYTIGGTVVGLTSSVVLQNNAADSLTLTTNGAFTFATSVASGSTYAVTVATQPALRNCVVSNAGGTATANVTNVNVVCSSSGVVAPVLSLSFQQTKVFHFSWNAIAGATTYRLMENATGSSGYSQVGADMSAATLSLDYAITAPLYERVNALYVVEACAGATCIVSTPISVSGSLAGSIGYMVEAVGYLKASNTDASDLFGVAVALSADGSTLVVGAQWEDSNAAGINGNQASNALTDSGAVYVFTRVGTVWTQQAYLKASNPSAGDRFGAAVALSADGNTLAIGAAYEDSNATGIGGLQTDNSVAESGAAYVFTRAGSTWTQQAYVKASNTGASDYFAAAIALSSDGNTLAVGALGEASNATTIGGNQANDSAANAGATYVFTRTATTWTQQSYIKAFNSGADDRFGWSVALSASGNDLVVGAYGEDSNAVGVGGDQNNNSTSGAGAVYVFTRAGSAWSQQAYVKASNSGVNDNFGIAVTVSADGNTLGVGAWGEASNTQSINGNQADNSAANAGAAYVFTRTATTWSQQSYLKAWNSDAGDNFGRALVLSGDGNSLLVGAYREDNNVVGIGGLSLDESATDSGAMYAYFRSGSTWAQRAYVKAPNTGMSDAFGSSVALSADGKIAATGAQSESSNATGVNGNQANDSMTSAGAVYIY
jgi:hypothetical protein